MTINQKVIRTLETYIFKHPFSAELKRFLKDQYSDEPWPYEYSEQDLYAHIKKDVDAYFSGNIDITIKSPLEKKDLEIEYLRGLYGDAMCEVRDLQKTIEELHELLWAHGFEPNQMIHSATHQGIHAEGTDVF